MLVHLQDNPLSPLNTQHADYLVIREFYMRGKQIRLEDTGTEVGMVCVSRLNA